MNYQLRTRRVDFRIVLLAPLTLAGMMVASGCATGPRMLDHSSGPPNTLSEEERAAGWELLFDGTSFVGWRGLGRDHIPQGHWTIEDGAIRKVASGDVPTAADGQPLEGGDIMTEETYRDFEFYFEWRVETGSNSGVKYNVSEDYSTAHEPRYAALGFEYQILDDDNHPDALNGPTRTASALYDMIPPNELKRLRPIGEYNSSRLIFVGDRGEHWLNGEKVVEYDMSSERFMRLLDASKYSELDEFAQRRDGHIVLQDHGDDVWFRNLKIRRR